MNSTATAALAYVNRGWMPVPLHGMVGSQCTCNDPREDHDRRQGGKHPIHGAWQQRDWRGWDGWSRHTGNVGIATGTPSGFWVLDYDPNGNLQTAGPIAARLDAEGFRPHVRTGGNGSHWRFAMPPDFEVTNRRGKLPAGLDVRGTGGQVVAPPSVSGKGPYVELRSGLVVDTAPGWLLGLIRPPSTTTALPGAPDHSVESAALATGSDREQRYAVAALRQICQEYAALGDGRRGDAAWHLACRAVELMNLGRLDEESTYNAVHAAVKYARENGPPGGLDDREVWRLWERARAEVGDRCAEMVGPDPIAGEVMPPGFAAPFSLAPQDGAMTITEPDWAAFARAHSTSNGGTTSPEITLGAPAPSDPFERAVLLEQWKINVRREAQRRIDAAAVAGRPALETRLLAADQLDQVSDPEPLIDGMLFVDSLARINGRPGQGKSFTAVDVACSVGTGRPWAGRPVRKGVALVVVAEGLSGFKRRVRGWERHHDVKLGTDLQLFAGAVQVGGPEWPAFVELASRYAPALIVLDTQARVTVGMQENDSTDMGVFVQGLETLREATGACVLIVHHAGKTGEAGRGSNAVEGAMTSELGVSKAGRSVVVRTLKQKDVEMAEPITLDLVQVPLEREVAPGMFEPDGDPPGVLVWRDPATGTADEMTTEEVGRARQRALWTVMHRLYDGSEGGTRAEIRTAWLAEPINRDLEKRARSTVSGAWATAWGGLIKLGLIEKNDRAALFRVIVLPNQSADGVLTANDGSQNVEPSAGFSPWVFDNSETRKRLGE